MEVSSELGLCRNAEQALSFNKLFVLKTCKMIASMK